MLKFTVYRDRWLRSDAWSSMLLNGEKLRCCMGFLAEACGLHNNTIEGIAVFRLLPSEEFWKLPEALRPVLDDVEHKIDGITRYKDAVATGELYRINDDPDLTDEEREKRLYEKLLSLGIEVGFSYTDDAHLVKEVP